MATYYDSSDQTFHPIPKARCYVLSNDSFMSGWGGAKGKINTCVVPCDSWEQAKAVERYVRTRSDQKRIRIATSVRPKPHVVYSICDWKRHAL